MNEPLANLGLMPSGLVTQEPSSEPDNSVRPGPQGIRYGIAFIRLSGIDMSSQLRS